MAGIGVVRPGGTDLTAQVLQSWGMTAVNSLPRAPHTLTEDQNTRALAQAGDVSRVLRNSDAVFFFCHGTATELLNGTAAMLDYNNIADTNGTIIVAIACHAGGTLADDAMNHGCRAWVGFNDLLAWSPGYAEQETGTACTLGCLELLQGGAADTARARMERRFDQLVWDLRSNPLQYYPTQPDATLAWLWAFWSRSHLVVKGTGTATL